MTSPSVDFSLAEIVISASLHAKYSFAPTGNDSISKKSVNNIPSWSSKNSEKPILISCPSWTMSGLWFLVLVSGHFNSSMIVLLLSSFMIVSTNLRLLSS